MERDCATAVRAVCEAIPSEWIGDAIQWIAIGALVPALCLAGLGLVASIRYARVEALFVTGIGAKYAAIATITLMMLHVLRTSGAL